MRLWLGLCFSVGSFVQVSMAHAEVEVIEAPIVDGRRGSAADIRATVSLVDDSGESFCTGTLIAPRVVVTAAHCVVDESETGEVTGVRSPGELEVVAGAIDVGSASSGQRYALSAVVPHEGYPNETTSGHPSGAGRFDDVALLILSQPVAGMTPAYVPSVEEAVARLTVGTSVIITGYGATSPNTEDSGILYTAETPFETRIDAEIVLGSEGTPDTCPGDSGGPAYLVVSGATWLVGVTSRATENSVEACGGGGVYGFAPAYRGWFSANSQGLYTGGAVDPVDPVDPIDECDPEFENCDECDPEFEDCEDFEECDPEFEDCEDFEDDGCAGGGLSGLTLGGLFLVGLALRRRIGNRPSRA